MDKLLKVTGLQFNFPLLTNEAKCKIYAKKFRSGAFKIENITLLRKLLIDFFSKNYKLKKDKLV